MLALLKKFSWQELLHHPWRTAAAVLAITLGVALAFSVHLINASALSEFAQAVQSVNGQPDLELRASQGSLNESLFPEVARNPQVAVASPVLEVSTYMIAAGGKRQLLRVVGVDALEVARVAPALMPVPDNQAGADRFAVFAPGNIFLNAAALQALGPAPDTATRTVQVQIGLTLREARSAGTVAATGAPLAVMDIAAAQDFFGKQGELSRIDVRLQPGVDPARFLQDLQAQPDWPPNATATRPGDAASRVSSLSRAYRVNLTVLALVALFTGAFLVFSVLALSVSKRAQQFALLGVLGLTGRERLQLVLVESAVLGLIGSVAGIAVGTGLAALALKLLDGDLGGGYFAGVAPTLQFDATAAVVYGVLGVVAAGVGGWWPARAAQQLPLAQTLKGLGGELHKGSRSWVGIVLIAGSAILAWAPPVFELPLVAYFSVAFLLLGGITVLPACIGWLYDRVAPALSHRLLPMLVVERARRVRESAAVAVSGVVASLSLAVALTVMVGSFRESVNQWLDVVLPAQLFVRTAGTTLAGDTLYFSPEWVQQVASVPGVQRVSGQRTQTVLLDPLKPAITLMARPLDNPAKNLPLVAGPLPVPAGEVGIFVSEAMVDLYGAAPGQPFALLSHTINLQKSDENTPSALVNHAPIATYFVAGVWRDYARQAGSIVMDQQDYVRLTGDQRTNDLALWLQSDADPAQVQAAIRALGNQKAGASTSDSAGDLIEFASASEIRVTSLRIFDRSFAVTYWLQAVAIGIGLFGIAASFSAQVLARRKEFGLLAHLGLTRRQILAVVAGEGLAWTVIGAIAGLALGLGVSLVLVYVVNPQSFHWTMDLVIPWSRLLLLCGTVILAGTVTAWLAGRAAAGRDAVLAVKEDW